MPQRDRYYYYLMTTGAAIKADADKKKVTVLRH
jgi:hypothetical protein